MAKNRAGLVSGLAKKKLEKKLSSLGLGTTEALNIRTRIQTDPVWFLKTFFDVSVWEKQREILEAIRDTKRVAVKSGNGVGKTFIAACAVLWFLVSHSPSIVLTTAPTFRQVEGQLWEEIRGICSRTRVQLGGEITNVKIKMAEKWFALGMSTDEADKFRGYHQKNMLIVFDEASGIDKKMWDAAKSLMTSYNPHFLAIGNPMSPSGDFYDAFHSKDWRHITISCFDSPNVKEGKQIFPGVVTKEWVEEQRNDWGENNPLWQSCVLGEFPLESEFSMFPLSWLHQCVVPDCTIKDSTAPVVIGADVARGGEDENVQTVIKGNRLVRLVHFRDTMKNLNIPAGYLKTLDDEFNARSIAVDDIAVGGGLTDILSSDNKLYPKVVSFNSSMTPEEPDKFTNTRTEALWRLRVAFKDKKIEIPEEYKDRLFHQLSAIEFELTTDKKIKAMTKEKVIEKLGKSPNDADSLMMANYVREYDTSLIIGEKDTDKEKAVNWAKPIMPEKMPEFIGDEDCEVIG